MKLPISEAATTVPVARLSIIGVRSLRFLPTAWAARAMLSIACTALFLLPCPAEVA